MGAAGVIAAGNLSSRTIADTVGKTPELKAAEEKIARDAAAKAKAKNKGKIKSVIQIFLWGGMSHNDSWDPKPGTGYDYLGELDKVIPTNVSGIQIGRLFPKLAKLADKYSLIRSMTHGNNGHETAAYLMQTGHLPGGRLAYPGVGAVFAYFKKDDYKGLIPPYVVMTQAAGRFSEEGFLGPAYKPFATGGDPNAARFEVQGIINRGIDDARQVARRDLVDKVDLLGYGIADVPEMAAAQEAKQKAYGLILGKGREVFNLENEPTVLRDRYGRNTFGQECLAARRMVESGVPYVTISFPGGWDTQSNHFATMERQCPMLDQGVAALLADLSERGLLENGGQRLTRQFVERAATLAREFTGAGRVLAPEPLAQFAQRRIEPGLESERGQAVRTGAIPDHMQHDGAEVRIHIMPVRAPAARGQVHFHVTTQRWLVAELHHRVAEVRPGLAVQEAGMQHAHGPPVSERELVAQHALMLPDRLQQALRRRTSLAQPARARTLRAPGGVEIGGQRHGMLRAGGYPACQRTQSFFVSRSPPRGGEGATSAVQFCLTPPPTPARGCRRTSRC